MQQDQQQRQDGVTHNTAESRYEITVDGEVAGFAEYSTEGDAVRFTHTEVDEAWEGQGLASKLAAFALDDVRSRGLQAVPQCRFIARYIARHEKDYAELVPR
jgi:predicted GNAT family acetyltransferase